MKLPTKLLVLLGLAVCSLSAMADVKYQHISAHKEDTSGGLKSHTLLFNLQKVNTLCNSAKALGIGCGANYGWGDTTTERLQVTGDHYDKDIFLIKREDGVDYIFPDLASAQAFLQKFIDAIEYPADKPLAHFLTLNKSGLGKVVVAVLYQENGVTKFLILPNKWDDVGENHTYQLEGEANLHLVSPF